MTELATIAPPAPRQERRYHMSYAEYAQWVDEDTHAEWVDGEVTVFMPPLFIHQDIAGFLFTLMNMFAKAHNLGTALIAPFEVRTIPNRSYREPDIIFVARENLHLLSERRMEAAPDVIVEVVSRESSRRDYHEKFAEYEQVGVREYWLIDPRPEGQQMQWHRRNAQGRYEAVGPDGQGRYHSEVLPGFWVHPDWLWQSPLPDPLATLAQIAPHALRRALKDVLGADDEPTA